MTDKPSGIIFLPLINFSNCSFVSTKFSSNWKRREKNITWLYFKVSFVSARNHEQHNPTKPGTMSWVFSCTCREDSPPIPSVRRSGRAWPLLPECTGAEIIKAHVETEHRHLQEEYRLQPVPREAQGKNSQHHPQSMQANNTFFFVLFLIYNWKTQIH